jgi:Dolichyl-phosphate-mannose-protein mannosyltransferase
MSGPRTPRTVLAAALVLLALYFAMAWCSKLRESTTSDELVHVTSGYAYWAFNDYRLQPENGNLPQRWEALPLWISGATFPRLEQPYWHVSDAWVIGHQFFYETGEDHFPRLMAARAMAALLGVGLGALIFAWSRRLFGTAGAFVSLVFYVFSPAFLAHGGLATSDVCMAFLMLAAVGAYWRHLNTPGLLPFLASCTVFGLACVAKFSAVLLLPMLALCALAYALHRRGEYGSILLSAAGHAIAAWAVIWAFYGFRYSAFNPALPAATQFIQPWDSMYAHTGGAGRLIHRLADLHALPEAFLYGAAYVVETSQVRAAFLNGEYSIGGWRTFFLWAFALKTTLPFMVASVASLGCLARAAAAPRTLRERADALFPFIPLLALFAVYWAFSIASHLNIGHRHLLPVYPVLFILAGFLGRALTGTGRAAAAGVALLLGWHACESLAVAPHYLAYFNELAGGPAGGYRHLVDSSLDWGQDLPGLKAWLDANRRPGEEAYLSYMGTSEPRYYGMPVRRLAYINGFQEDEPYVPLHPGLYCVSATMLQQVYTSVRGPWTIDLEKEYQFLRSFEPAFGAYASDPEARRRLEQGLPPEKWKAARDRFMHLRFARLCYYLRVRRPEAVIGYSIFVYRLSADEVAGATAGSLSDWAALISRSGVARGTP